MIKRISIYGESWRGSMPHSILLALTRLGYDAIIFDYQQYLCVHAPAGNRIFNKAKYILDQINFKKRCVEINKHFIRHIEDFSPDLIIVVKGLHIMPESLQKIQNLGIPVVCWHVDDFFNPRYITPFSEQTFPLYDIHFSARVHLFEEYKKRGCQRLAYLEFCFDPTVFYPISSAHKGSQCDVSFIGGWSKNRENLLKELSSFNVLVYGSGWHRVAASFIRMPNIHLAYKFARLEDFSKVVSRSKICLNILTAENRDQTNLRNFEVPACMGFQLSNRTMQLQKIFKENTSIAMYEGEEELVEKVKYYLQNEKERTEIAQNGFDVVVKNEHTFTCRCRQIISRLKLL